MARAKFFVTAAASINGLYPNNLFVLKKKKHFKRKIFNNVVTKSWCPFTENKNSPRGKA